MMAGISEVDALFRLLPALAVVVLIPLGVLWWSRQRRGFVQGVRVAAKTPLGKNTWIAVVEADERRFLVGTGEAGIGLIAELEPVPVPADDGLLDGDLSFSTDPRTGLIQRLQQRTIRRAAPVQGSPGDLVP
jgi:flagellar biogenesis protein FliO